MEKRQNVAQDVAGNRIPQATITITEYPGGATATIYSDNAGASKPNPFISDLFGNYEYYAPNGRYIETAAKTGYTTEQLADVTLFDGSQLSKASKAEAAALTLTQYDAGVKIFITSADGGEFTVRYNATPGTYADNGGASCGQQFIPTGGDGTIGIVRDDSGPVKSTWFGAVADWTGAAGTSTDNGPALQLANDYLTAAYGGGTIYTPAGEYYVGTSVTPDDNINFIGDGHGYNTSGTAFYADVNLFILNGQDLCGFRHFAVRGADAVHTGSAFYFAASTNTKRLSIEYVFVTAMYSAMYCADSSLITTANIDNCTFIYNRYWHVYTHTLIIWNMVEFNSTNFDAQYNAAEVGHFKHTSGSLGWTTFNNCLFQSAAALYSIYLTSSSYASFNECLFYYTAIPVVSAPSTPVDGATHLYIGSGTGHVVLNDCQLSPPMFTATNFNHITKVSARAGTPLVLKDCTISLDHTVGTVTTSNPTQPANVTAVRCKFTGGPVAAQYDMFANAGSDVSRIDCIGDTSRTQIISNIVRTLRTTDATITTIAGGQYLFRPSTNYLMHIVVTGKSDDDVEYAVYDYQKLVTVSSVHVAVINTVGTDIILESTAAMSSSVVAIGSGTASVGAVVRVTGLPATNIDWVCNVSITAVGEDAGYYP